MANGKSRSHILLTTDFSAESMRAFEPVVDLAQRLGARVTLLHAIVGPHLSNIGFPAPGPTTAQMDELVAASERQLQDVRAQLPSELEVELATASGDRVEQVIADHAAANGVTLIAMATHGRTGFRRVLMGSVAEGVLHSTGTPVLLFPPSPAS